MAESPQPGDAGHRTRPYRTPSDSTLISCRHTALIPLEVKDRGDGYLLLMKAECGNCGAIVKARGQKV